MRFLVCLCALLLISTLLVSCSGISSEIPTATAAAGPTGATPGEAVRTETSPAPALPTDTDSSVPPSPVPSATFTASPSATATAVPTDTPFFAALPSPATAAWQEVASGLELPVGIASAFDGSGRLFILEQSGRIRILRDGSLLDQPFLDISGQLSCCGERGLLGLAFHPRYNENGYFYVNYTDTNGDTSISRFQVSSQNPDLTDPASEKRLLFVRQPYRNHNGGAVVFGPDGYLYLGLGDGGSGGDPHGYGQSTQTLLGKILRVDVDSGDPYAIPPDNPFAASGGLPEIWAYGLRNPWRIAFDRTSGDLYIADVGQNAYEELNFLPGGAPLGANFGWAYREAAHPFAGQPPDGVELIDPVAEYDHGSGCSVTGGAVYRGASLPDWQGVYMYGDYCSGLVWGLRHSPDGSWQQGLLYETGLNITSFGEDEAGEMYLADYSGTIYRLSPAQQ